MHEEFVAGSVYDIIFLLMNRMATHLRADRPRECVYHLNISILHLHKFVQSRD